jgi:archaellum component FlaC
MDILELKSVIIARVDQLEDEAVLQQIRALLEDVESDWGKGSIEILGNVDWDELENEANEPITPENSLTEVEFNEWRKQMKWI